MKPFESYVICTSPRSGSTLLCSLLRGAGHAGWPDSHFHEPSLACWMNDYGLRSADFGTTRAALQAVMDAARTLGKGKSDIFGLRLQRHSAAFFFRQLSVLHPSQPDDRSRLHATFGRTLFIHLTRESKLDQATSFVKAQQSGLWHKAPDGTELERLSAPRPLKYDAAAIVAQIALSEQMEVEWEAWFAAEKIKPLRVTYSELAAAPNVTLARILDALRLERGMAIEGAPPLAKLADEINQDWAERFRVQLGN